jgi:hypothetical protein
MPNLSKKHFRQHEALEEKSHNLQVKKFGLKHQLRKLRHEKKVLLAEKKAHPHAFYDDMRLRTIATEIVSFKNRIDKVEARQDILNDAFDELERS